MPVTLELAVFQGFPEAIALTALVMSLGGLGLRWKTICLIALVQTACECLLRVLSAPGVHVIWATITLTVCMILIAKMELRQACLWTAVGMAFLVILELITLYPITKLGNISLEQLSNNKFLLTICTMSRVVITLLLAFIINRIRQRPKKSPIPWPRQE